MYFQKNDHSKSIQIYLSLLFNTNTFNRGSDVKQNF